jgi:hypothetical protein
MNVSIVALVLFSLSWYPRADPPFLTIRGVTPRREASSDTMCSVRLANTHTRAATAWVLETLPARTEGGAYDRAASRGLWLRPNEETTITYACPVGEAPALEVVAVLYEDNGVAGNRDKLSTHVVAARFKLATGLRQLGNRLQTLTAAGNIGASNGEQLLAFIESTADPRIDNRTKEEARTVLLNLLRAGRPQSEPLSPIVAALRAELQKSIEALEVFSLQAVAR